MDAFDFFEPEREPVLDIRSCVGIMCQFIVIMETVVLVSEAEGTVPFHPCLFPLPEPFELSARLHKKLHFHLFKFPHAEDKLSGNDLIPEGFSYLGNAKGKLHSARLLHVQEIHKNSLSSLGTQINFHCPV